jgi:small subunit ribosomal protein S6
MTRLYDLMLMLDPEAPEERRVAILSNVQTAIEDAEGATLVAVHDWGSRKMTFEINHHPEAEYHLFQFESSDNTLLQRLDHNLKITDGVLRFRIFKVDPEAPANPPPEFERLLPSGGDRGDRERRPRRSDRDE